MPTVRARLRAAGRNAALAAALSLALASLAAAQDTTATAPPATPTAEPAATAATTTAAAAPAALGPWAPGRQWISLRLGYAKSATDHAANGNIGGGFGYTAMGKSMWSVGAFAHLEMLGRFGSATEIEVPLTVEFARHAAWRTTVRPYVGMGGGAFYHKTYRTGGDSAELRPGFYVLAGINAPISDSSLMGLDVRAVFQGSVVNDDPVFGTGTADATHWSVKLNYARVQ